MHDTIFASRTTTALIKSTIAIQYIDILPRSQKGVPGSDGLLLFSTLASKILTSEFKGQNPLSVSNTLRPSYFAWYVFMAHFSKLLDITFMKACTVEMRNA